jgi:hypothetical protein
LIRFLAVAVVLAQCGNVSAQCTDPSAPAQFVKCAPKNKGWICLSPKLAAANQAEKTAAAARCKAEKEAIKSEAETVLRRDVGKIGLEKKVLEVKFDLALTIAKRAEILAASRWSTLEVVAWVAGAVVVGAAAGGFAGYYWR